jgi:hypothetical protein
VSTGAELVRLVSISASSNVLHPYGELNAIKRRYAARVTADNLLVMVELLLTLISRSPSYPSVGDCCGHRTYLLVLFKGS